MQMMVWQAARRPVLVSRHFSGEEWDRKIVQRLVLLGTAGAASLSQKGGGRLCGI